MSSIAISLFGVFELPRFIDSAGKKLIGASSLTPWKTDGAHSQSVDFSKHERATGFGF